MAEEESTSGGSFKSKLSEKAGPLPVWGWVLVVSIGGYVLYRYYQNKQAASSSTATQNPGPVTVQDTGLTGGSDTGIQEQLNDINTGITNGDNELATIGTNIGQESKNVQGIAKVVTRPGNLHDPADIQHYFIVHNTKDGRYFYVNQNEHTAFVLSAANARKQIAAYHPNVITETKSPYFSGDKLLWRTTK